MLLSYVAMDNYLKDRGRLGFVITQSVFKTAGAGQGFRRFVLGSGTPVRVVAVDDMANLKPFEGASNRTAIVVLERGRTTKYPVSYSQWYKPGGGSVISEDVTLEEVTREKIATYRQFVAQPVDETDLTAPWITARPRALRAVKKVLGASDYQAHAGAYTGGANGVYWLEIVGQRPDGLVVVSNLTEGAKREVENVQAAIEPDLLYPILRGRDVGRWLAQPSAYILMVQDPLRRRGYDEDWLSVKYPKTYAYLKHFEGVLLERRDRGTRGLIEKGAPFYSMFAVSDYTFAPYKVVWTRVAKDIRGAVVDLASVLDIQKPIVPIETVVLVAFETEEEAHYFCAVLNSTPWRFAIDSSSVHSTGGFGSPNVLGKARIPRFNLDDSYHLQLAKLSRAAHQATAAGDTARVQVIEAEIDRLAAQLWGLTEGELREIQESLAELR